VTTASGLPDPDQIIPAGTLQARNMPLDQFFLLYSLISGRTVLRPNALAIGQQGGSVTLEAQTDWTRREAVFAMDAALMLNGVAMIPVEEKFVKAVPVADAPTQGAQIGKVSPGNYTDTEQFVTQIIELKALKPTEMAQLLSTFTKTPNGITPFDNNNIIVIRDYASNVKRMLEVIKQTDAVKEPEYTLMVIPIKYGKVEDFYNTMSSLISGSGGGGLAGTAPTGAGGMGAMGGGMRNRAGMGSGMGSGSMGRTGYGSGMGGGSYGGYGGGYGGSSGSSYGRGYMPQQVDQPTGVGGAQSSFQRNLQNIVSRAAKGGTEEIQLLENARIVPDARANTLLIYANKRDMSMITNVVSKLDTLLAQVLIEAVVFEVSLGDSLNLGVSMIQNPKRFGQDFTGTGAIQNGQGFLGGVTNLSSLASSLPGGFSYFGKVGDDFDIAVRAIAENSNVNIVSRPRIQTSHAIPGSFFVGQTVPFVTGSYNNYYGGVGGNTTQSIVERLPVGFNLDVVPYITPEGYVVMEIYQTFSSLGRDVIIDGNPNPVVNDRNASAMLTVRDGQTILMGGFITESRSKSRSGVPILKDIPGLGALFRSKNDKNDRSELIVMMRAKVLHTPEEAADVADVERRQLMGIQRAEKDFQKGEDKRRKQMKAGKE
jgi:general secretion pathway protein D